MEIHNIKDVSDRILDDLTTVMNRDCQVGKFTLKELRDNYSKHTDICYLFVNGEPVYFLLLDVFPKQKIIYIHDVCKSKAQEIKGIFKSSLVFLTSHYSKKGFKKFTLDASDSTKESGLNQKARIHIFSKAGFVISPETGIFNESGDYKIINTIVSLTSGEKVTIQSKNKISQETYNVKTDTNAIKQISQTEIVNCYDDNSNQISCPMMMDIPKSTSKRKTRKHRVFYKKLSSTLS
jgi:hypothetical protein